MEYMEDLEIGSSEFSSKNKKQGTSSNEEGKLEWRTHKNEKFTSYREALRYLLKKYATKSEVYEADEAINQFLKSTGCL